VDKPIFVENYRPGMLRGLAAKVHERVAKNLWSEPQIAEKTSKEVRPAIAASPAEKRTL